MLFTERSLLTMIHGIVLGGGAMMALAAALFAIGALTPRHDADAARTDRTRAIAALMLVIATILWVTVLTGTYVVFPPYRMTPPAGITELTPYPRSLLLSRPDTAWLHAFAMESKEHQPWIAAMLATALAFVAMRYPRTVLSDPWMRGMTVTLLAICFAITAFAALMGTFINKVAPLE